MFFNWMNLDTKLRVAILGQDFALCCDTFRFVTPKTKPSRFMWVFIQTSLES